MIFCDAIDKEVGSRQAIIGGVKTVVQNVARELDAQGYKPDVQCPDDFLNVRMPTYPEIRLALPGPGAIRKVLRDHRPDAVLNMTPELTLGLFAMRACRRYPSAELDGQKGIFYDTVYSTRIDIYAEGLVDKVTHGRLKLNPATVDKVTRRIHRESHRVLTPTEKMREKLDGIGVKNIVVWPGGVDSKLFKPLEPDEANAYTAYDWHDGRPVLLDYGRLSFEKDYPEFLSLETPGFHKVVIGDGPQREELESRFADKDTHFLGKKYGERLARHVRSARLMIFPSKFETDGLVVKEAAASGVPVVAYNVEGPCESIDTGINGVLIPQGQSLLTGIPQALQIDPRQCAEYTTGKYSWTNIAQALVKNLAPNKWKEEKSRNKVGYRRT